MDGSEGVCAFCDVFGKFGGVVSCSEYVPVFLEPSGKASAGLPYICYPQSAHVNLYTPDRLKTVACALTVFVQCC